MLKLEFHNRSALFIKVVFFIALFIISIVGGIAYNTTRNLSESSDLLVHTYVVNVELEKISSYLKDAETGQRGYIITKDSSFLQPYLQSREKINNSFAELKELTKNDTTQQENLKSLNLLINKKLNNLKKTSSYAITNDLDSPEFETVFLLGKNLMDRIRLKITVMTTHENNILSQRQRDYKSDAMLTPIFLFTLLLLSIVLVLLTYFKILKDIRNLKRANQELEIVNELAHQSEIISKHGNWVWNMDDNTYRFSDNLYRLLGEEPHSFPPTSEKFMDFVHPEDKEMVADEVAKMMENQNLPFINYRIIQKNGNIKYFKAYGQAMHSDNAEQIIGTISDITDEVDNYRLMEERNQELERNNKELSAFNHVASHDLQEPLRKIQTFLSRLTETQSEQLSEKGNLYISRIQDAASRMRLLIDDLLQFSRTNKAEKELVLSDINMLLEGAKQDLAEALSDSNAVVQAGEFPEMKVIPFQIQQLFLNLIGNSIKYRKATITPIIDINYEQINSSNSHESELLNANHNYYHKLTFTDNGIGFDNQYAKKIFVLFNRLHNKEDYGGTGIGLSICKKIVENHDGYISAKGSKGEGATFNIYLPV